MRLTLAIVLTWLFCAAPTLAGSRLALVIGNDDYQNIV